jgi:hypothetical protein
MRHHPIYVMNVIISLDQTFNAMANGNMDCTISARLGYLYVHRRSWWTDLLMKVVDTTFYPVDGVGHCLGAYYLDQDEYYIRGNRIALMLLGVFVVLGCLLVVVPILLVALYKWFSRKG